MNTQHNNCNHDIDEANLIATLTAYLCDQNQPEDYGVYSITPDTLKKDCDVEDSADEPYEDDLELAKANFELAMDAHLDSLIQVDDEADGTSPIDILNECITLQESKARDYQNDNSTIVQADYYPRGLATIFDIIHAKVLRARSVLEAMEYDDTYEPNFESLEDSLKDMINYAAFAVSWSRGGIEGQDLYRDELNRLK